MGIWGGAIADRVHSFHVRCVDSSLLRVRTGLERHVAREPRELHLCVVVMFMLYGRDLVPEDAHTRQACRQGLCHVRFSFVTLRDADFFGIASAKTEKWQVCKC